MIRASGPRQSCRRVSRDISGLTWTRTRLQICGQRTMGTPRGTLHSRVHYCIMLLLSDCFCVPILVAAWALAVLAEGVTRVLRRAADDHYGSPDSGDGYPRGSRWEAGGGGGGGGRR